MALSKDSIEKDLFGEELTEEEHGELHEDVQSWRDELVYRLQDLDRQLTARRAQSLDINTKEFRKTYETWKRAAVGRKLAIISRLKDVNVLLKDKNRETYGTREQVNLQILAELKSIRTILQVLAQPQNANKEGDTN